MYKTIEQQVRKHDAPPTLRREFRQHDFESLHSFCLLILCISIAIWTLFDLIASYLGEQDFTWISMAFITVMVSLTIVLVFTRKAGHFDILNLVFIGVITLAIRLVIEGLPQDLRPGWLMLGASSVLYSVSVLPVRRWSFFATLLVTWYNLNPFQVPGMELFDLRGIMLLSYMVFINGLILYTYLKMRRAKLYNFCMSKVLLEQAYVDALTEIPNRRSFMAKAQSHLQEDDVKHRYLAMIDIDNFKRVNDQFGHDIGDEVLKRTADNIKASVSEFSDPISSTTGPDLLIVRGMVLQETGLLRTAAQYFTFAASLHQPIKILRCWLANCPKSKSLTETLSPPISSSPPATILESLAVMYRTLLAFINYTPGCCPF